jgi:hypothetical protein
MLAATLPTGAERRRRGEPRRKIRAKPSRLMRTSFPEFGRGARPARFCGLIIGISIGIGGLLAPGGQRGIRCRWRMLHLSVPAQGWAA